MKYFIILTAEFEGVAIVGSELWIVLLFALGLSLIVAEIFLVGVVLGLIGLTCMLVSIYFGFEKSAGLGWTLVVIAAASVPVLAFVWVKVINRVLAMKFTQTGYTSAQMQYKDLVGQEGVALTTLRPAGMARFGEKKVDVVSEGEVVERDSRVRVIEVRGNRVVVRAVRS
jgi:membrane-bound serine protease (ClpP class)